MTDTPVLSMTTETIHRVGYSAFSDFVNKVYGTSQYNFVAAELSSNDVSHSFSVEQTPVGSQMDTWDVQDLEKFKAANGLCENITDTLFQDLVDRRLIPEGEYIIDVCW